MQKSSICIICIIILAAIVLLSGCNSRVDSSNSDGPTINNGANAVAPENIAITNMLESGQLLITVNKAQAVNNLSAANINMDGIHRADSNVSIGEIEYMFNEFYDEETGKLMDGCWLILLDLTIINDGATSIMGATPDTFRADSLLWLINGEDPRNSSGNQSKVYTNYVDYFSSFDPNSVHDAWSFQVADGESIDLQIGYFIAHSSDDFSDLFGSTHSNPDDNKDKTLINLNVTQQVT